MKDSSGLNCIARGREAEAADECKLGRGAGGIRRRPFNFPRGLNP